MANPFETEGMFSWFELITDDVESSKIFYGELLSWEFLQDKNNKEYTLVKIKGANHPIAGITNKKNLMVENPQAVPSHWGNYISVKNIDAIVSKVEKLNGKIIVPCTDIPKVGRFCVIQDPSDAVIALIEYNLTLGKEE